jgi:hypothetical protein
MLLVKHDQEVQFLTVLCSPALMLPTTTSGFWCVTADGFEACDRTLLALGSDPAVRDSIVT